MHNFNLIFRIVAYIFWAWILFFDGFHLSFAFRTLVNFIFIADIVTWVLYQLYLLPKMALHFGLWALVHLAVVVILIKGVRAVFPQSPELRAMAAMVFLAVAGIKGMYYFLLETGSGDSH